MSDRMISYKPEKKDLVIIGAGPTGLFATFCAGLRDIDSVTLEAMDSTGGQLTALYPEKDVYDVQGIPKIKAEQLVRDMTRQAEFFGSKILLNSKVTDIISRPDSMYDVEVNGKIVFTTKTILISSGIGSFDPVKLGVEGEDEYRGKGVVYTVRNAEDFRDRKVVIVGAGDSAFDWAEELSAVASKVHIVQRGTRIRAAERTVKAVLDKPNVTLNMNSSPIKILGDAKGLRNVVTRNALNGETTEYEADRILVAIGLRSAPVSFRSISLDVDGKFITVNEKFETNLKGIYAVGDGSKAKNAQKVLLIAVGGAEAYMAINNIKKYLDPKSSIFGGHSSSMTGQPEAIETQHTTTRQ
ncbi:MAG: NAD(P)/FAD-dependent oxidoreductase [Thermoplasmataceae archaeon]